VSAGGGTRQRVLEMAKSGGVVGSCADRRSMGHHLVSVVGFGEGERRKYVPRVSEKLALCPTFVVHSRVRLVSTKIRRC